MITPQKKVKLAKTEKMNEIIEALNPLLRLEGSSGIKITKSDTNIVISLDDEGDPEGGDAEEYQMWVCQIIDGVPTPVLKTFLVKPEEVVD